MLSLSTCKQVVEKIKAVPNETRLLVVDQAADRYFAEKGISISGDMPCVQHITCPPAKPPTGSWVVTLFAHRAVYSLQEFLPRVVITQL